MRFVNFFFSVPPLYIPLKSRVWGADDATGDGRNGDVTGTVMGGDNQNRKVDPDSVVWKWRHLCGMLLNLGIPAVMERWITQPFWLSLAPGVRHCGVFASSFMTPITGHTTVGCKLTSCHQSTVLTNNAFRVGTVSSDGRIILQLEKLGEQRPSQFGFPMTK